MCIRDRFVRGRWVTIVVDDYFPVMAAKPFKPHAGEAVWWLPCFARMSRSDLQHGLKEYWPMLIEKAFAKLFGSYAALEGGRMGDVLQYLSGGLNSMLVLSSETSAADLWHKFQKVLEGPRPGQLLAMLRNDQTDGGLESPAGFGLYGGHCYSVLQLVQHGELQLVQVRNPWGLGEWTGQFSRTDTASWKRHPELKAEAERVTGCSLYQGSTEEKGVFWMPFEAFVSWFQVEVCDTGRTERQCTTVRGQWHAGLTCGGRLDNKESWVSSGWGQLGQLFKQDRPATTMRIGECFKFNPRFVLKVKKGRRVYVTLSQTDVRHHAANSPDVSFDQACIQHPVVSLYLLDPAWCEATDDPANKSEAVPVPRTETTCDLAAIPEEEPAAEEKQEGTAVVCLLYTSDAADEEDSVDLCGRRFIKKKKSQG
eukprot:TRINITY_DN44838_c0_g1_i1.p1 TRINITY_DN44838_c0_g1~~TRINITY_DN44838_c0_g1_i1.p1  ORF type:complete len:424 (-),score=121.91 TRINITY_DN44838_c0_g1_i1:40-1311(-)